MRSIHEKNIERLSEDSIFRVNGISMKLAKLGNEKKKRDTLKEVLLQTKWFYRACDRQTYKHTNTHTCLCTCFCIISENKLK